MNIFKKIGAACKQIAATFSPNCHQASKLQSQAMDKPLPPAGRFGLKMHLFLCGSCRRYGQQIRLLHDITQTHPDQIIEAMPQKLPDDAKARMKENLRKNI